MRAMIAALTTCMLSTGATLACDDHHGTCEIEDWRSVDMFGSLMIEGVATCDNGTVNIRLYDASGAEEKFVGTAHGFVEQHSFTAIASDVKQPAKLAIKYSIRAE